MAKPINQSTPTLNAPQNNAAAAWEAQAVVAPGTDLVRDFITSRIPLHKIGRDFLFVYSSQSFHKVVFQPLCFTRHYNATVYCSVR